MCKAAALLQAPLPPTAAQLLMRLARTTSSSHDQLMALDKLLRGL